MALQSVYTKLFKHVLEKLGYPSDDINWSLGYCQGDGVSFTGLLDVKVLAKRLCPDIDESVWNGLPDDFVLELNRNPGMRYVHERSTYLSYDLEGVVGANPDDWGGVAQKVAYARFVQLLEADVVATGSRLGDLGYKIREMSGFDAEMVKSIQTQNFRVEIFKVPDENWDLDFTFGEEEPLDDVIAKIESATSEIACIKVRVLQIDEDGEEVNELHELHVGSFHYDKDGPVFGKCTAREYVSEAIQQARSDFNKQRRVTLKAA